MSTKHSRCLSLLRISIYTTLSVLGLFLIPTTDANAQAVANNNPAFLQVYVNNIENLTGPINSPEGCGAEYMDLIEYIKTQDYVPDLFIVQQISDEDQADSYAALLQSELDPNWNPTNPDSDYEYGYVIAEASPTLMNSPCGSIKAYQSNAIFYRTARLQPVDPNADPMTWQTKQENGCILNTQSRTISVAELFRDTLTGEPGTAKRVAAGSMHWVTKNSGGTPASSECNIEDINARMESFGSDLIVLGGDANDEDRGNDWDDWYKLANGALAASGNFGYTDPIYNLCENPNNGQVDLTCLGENLTFNNSAGTNPRRIDFLFVKQPGSPETVVTDQHTISFTEADQAANTTIGNSPIEYSDHRAIRARVYYQNDPIPSPPSVYLSEVLYDAAGTDDGWEWVEFYNGTSEDIDLSGYSLGYGGSDYTYGVVQLSGIIQAGQTFVVGGPATTTVNRIPVYDQIFNFDPDLQNSDNSGNGNGDGVALFAAPASDITPNTRPIDAVIYGANNNDGLIDETGLANQPDVGDAVIGESIERTDLAGAWQVQPNPTPNQTSLSPPSNQMPLVLAGADQSVNLPDTVALIGFVTDDNFPGNPLTITWTQVSGPAGGSTTFADPSSATTTAAFNVAGTYVLRLKGDDGEFSQSDYTAVTVSAAPTPGGSLLLSEVLYDPSGEDDRREWVELYNSSANAIDLSDYSLGYSGPNYVTSNGGRTIQLSGIIQARQTFVVGGPAMVNGNSNPVYDQVKNMNPNLDNGGSAADGVALFSVSASAITVSTIPIDAVIYGANNRNNLIDETGEANAPEVDDASAGKSIERINLAGDWQIQPNPTPNTVHPRLLD